MEDTYAKNKRVEVGAEMRCPTCNTLFIKKVKGQTFCNTKKKRAECKDEYHRLQDEIKRNKPNEYTGH